MYELAIPSLELDGFRDWKGNGVIMGPSIHYRKASPYLRKKIRSSVEVIQRQSGYIEVVHTSYPAQHTAAKPVIGAEVGAEIAIHWEVLLLTWTIGLSMILKKVVEMRKRILKERTHLRIRKTSFTFLLSTSHCLKIENVAFIVTYLDPEKEVLKITPQSQNLRHKNSISCG